MSTLNDPATVAPSGELHLVFGASGYIGRHLVPHLLAAGLPVRAAARSMAALEAMTPDTCERVAADALRPETLAPALQGVDTAYYLVHSMAAGPDFAALDRRAAGHFATAAAAAGVRRIVYLGALVPPGAASEHIRSRRQTGNALRGGPVPVTELRAGIIVGAGSAAFEVMRDLAFHLPVILAPRCIRRQSPPIALDNLLEYLARAPAFAATADRILDVAGPQSLNYAQMIREMTAAAGRRAPRILTVPGLSPRLCVHGLPLVTSVPKPIARALIEGMKQDFTADDGAIRELVPQELLDFSTATRRALAAEAHTAAATGWREGVFAFRNSRHDYAYYAKQARGSALAPVAPEALWQVVTGIGGKNRYFHLNGLWKLREVLDWFAGGPGLDYGRRSPTELRLGDRVDSWRVVALQPRRRLTLFFGMRAPGAGLLEFELTPEGQGTRVSATAYWHPAGIWGLLYWYALVPAHLFIFSGMTRAIARRAAERAGKDVATGDGNEVP